MNVRKLDNDGYALMRTLALVIAVFWSNAATATGSVAMISDCIGKVSVSTSGNSESCEILTNLVPGSELMLEPGGQVSLVYFSSGKEYVFDGRAHVSVGEDKPVSRKGPGPKVRNLAVMQETGLVPSGGENYAQAAIVLRGANAKKKIRLISPKNTSILDPHPVFRWEALGSATQYQFKLIDDAGRIVIESLVDETEFKLPAGTRIAEESLYTWRVEARTASGVVYSSSANFSVLDAGERTRLERLRPGPGAPVSERVVFASVLERMNLRDAAKQYWSALAKERPQNTGLKMRAGR